MVVMLPLEKRGPNPLRPWAVNPSPATAAAVNPPGRRRRPVDRRAAGPWRRGARPLFAVANDHAFGFPATLTLHFDAGKAGRQQVLLARLDPDRARPALIDAGHVAIVERPVEGCRANRPGILAPAKRITIRGSSYPVAQAAGAAPRTCLHRFRRALSAEWNCAETAGVHRLPAAAVPRRGVNIGGSAFGNYMRHYENRLFCARFDSCCLPPSPDSTGF